ncbi:hypothetical protein [uncultured Pigmentiphaga sp.]|uniref:hypothetical protein n=1 Tax=uncultured Pigmentiphaga sp. TaxID=340361 RepID=UPI00260D214A|nr:hypothetical protein [uncultured Pigmentiphaga sp.]
MPNIEHITIKIETGNSAFEEFPAQEIARILRDLAGRFERDGLPPVALRDFNGNLCGTVSIRTDDD